MEGEPSISLDNYNGNRANQPNHNDQANHNSQVKVLGYQRYGVEGERPQQLTAVELIARHQRISDFRHKKYSKYMTACCCVTILLGIICCIVGIYCFIIPYKRDKNTSDVIISKYKAVTKGLTYGADCHFRYTQPYDSVVVFTVEINYTYIGVYYNSSVVEDFYADCRYKGLFVMLETEYADYINKIAKERKRIKKAKLAIVYYYVISIVGIFSAYILTLAYLRVKENLETIADTNRMNQIEVY